MSTRVAKLALGASDMDLSDDAAVVRLMTNSGSTGQVLETYADAARTFKTDETTPAAIDMSLIVSDSGRYLKIDTGDATEAYLIIEEQ